MALQRGYGTGVSVSGASSQTGPRNFWLKPGTETTVVLLDEDPIEVVRHVLFLKGDKTAAKMRQTCHGMNPREHPEPCPRTCLVCNKALGVPRQIGRRGYLCSTLIDERAFEYQGKSFKDMKLLLELPSDSGDGWEQKKRTYGQMKYRRFRVYRSSTPPGKPQTTPRHGDQWIDMGLVDPVRHFWNSPAVQKIMEAAARRGEPIDHQQAVMKLISPIDYDAEIGQYKVEEAEAFVAYLEGRTGGGVSVPSGGYSAPPPPPSSQPGYGQPATGYPGQPGHPGMPPGSGYQTTPGGVAVPPGNVPSYPNQPSGQQAAPPQPGPQNPQPPGPPPQPQGQPQPNAYGQPGGAPSSPPPPVPDPQSAGGQMQPGGYAAPPPPQNTGFAPGQQQPPQAQPGQQPPWNAQPGQTGAPPQGLPPMPNTGPAPTANVGTPQEGVPRLPNNPAPGATPPQPGAYAPPGQAAPPAPPPGMNAPQPTAAGPGYTPPSGPPQGGPVPQPAGAPQAQPAPSTAPPAGGFDFQAGFNSGAAPGMPPAQGGTPDPMGF